MAPTSDPAPALTRGLRLVAILSKEGACSLDRLAKLTGWPKASLLRLLQALIQAGVAEREGTTKRYRTLVRFVADDSRAQRVRRCCLNHVTWLATCAKQPIEVYIVTNAGMTMVDRAAPDHDLPRIVARLGHTRPRNELDATNQMLYAFCSETHPLPSSALHVMTATGRAQLTSDAIDRLITAVRSQGYSCDVHVNKNNVRRFAAPLLNQRGDVVAALVLAHTNNQHPGPSDKRFITLVTSTAKRIGIIAEDTEQVRKAHRH